MTEITLRQTKGAPLTHDELDANFSNIKETADLAYDAVAGIGGKANAAALGVDDAALNMGATAIEFLTDNDTAKGWIEELGDVVGARSPWVYASRSEAEGANVPSPVKTIGVLSGNRVLNYVRDAAGTALTTGDGQNWSPADDLVTPLHFGAVGDGVTDDTAAIQAALNTTATRIYFPEGDYRIVDSNLNGTPVLTSSVANRTISGPGRITATTPVYRALSVSGDRSNVHLQFSGNSQIMSALYVSGDQCEVSGCVFRFLYAPASTYQAIAIYADLIGGDKSILITGNIFRDIEAVGDGVSGNGVGLARAVLLSANQAMTRASIVSNNIIDKVIGEEGDAIAVINYDGASYHDFPAVVIGNTVTTWTRRAVKVQANGVTIKGNLFQNTFSSDPGNMEHAVSLIQGGDHSVDGNTFINCRYGGQVSVNAGSAPERVDNISITNNIVRDIGAETSFVPFYVKTYGENIVVENNKVLCPNLAASNIISVPNALSGIVAGNYIDSASAAPYNFTGSTNLLLDISSDNDGVAGIRTVNTNGDALGIQVSGATTRSFTLYNMDQTLSDAEIISRLQFHQNDAGSNIVTASIRAVAVGSAGSTKIVICTGTTGAPDVPRWNVSIAGDFVPETDNSYDLGTSAARLAQSYVVQRYYTATVFDSAGTGTPEGVVTAGIGSTFRRTDGGAGTSFYVKQSGTGNTGWAAK